MPLSGQGRVDGLQAVILTHCPPCAVRTPSASVPIGNSGFPLMSYATNPPGFLIRVWSYIFGGQPTVLFRVPLFGQLRVNGLQAVISA
jgi:hypothetical protein